MVSDRTGYLRIVETGQCYLGFLLIWSTLYSLPLHSGIDEKFPGDIQDASICGNDRRADHYKFQKETREPATGKPWRILFP